MEFEKYQHIERIGTAEVNGLLDGLCYIFPKIDGANASVWLDDGVVKCGSRNRELSITSDNAGFCKAINGDSRFLDFLTAHPNLRLFGEWLVPHSLKTYRDDAWRKFYVFDVMDGCKYLTFETYRQLLEEFGIEYISPIETINFPTEEKLLEMLGKNQFLIKHGCGCGEGIVVKRYDFVNQYGRTVWGKVVTSEFREKSEKRVGVPKFEVADSVEEKICKKFLTNALIEKEVAKIELECGGWNSKLIPRLIGVLFHALVTEEIWSILKDFKNPTINFKKLNTMMIRELKLKKPLMF